MPSDYTTALLATESIEIIKSAIVEADDDLKRLNLEIWHNPELMFQEVKACKLLSEWLESKGWAVKRGVYGLDAAFEARFSVKPGGRTVCFNAEYDALPGIGHACGHNLIAISSLASALGAADAMEAQSIPGTVVLMGTPAEETGGGKYIMAKHGAWKDVDVCLMSHGVHNYSASKFATKASWKFRAGFHGRSSHAAASPETGLNACDAIVHAYNGLALLRQQISKTDSIQGVILEAGKAPNVIPDFAKGTFSLRSSNTTRVEELKNRVIPIFEGAAAATGCTVELFWDALYEDVVSNRRLAELYRGYMLEHLGMGGVELLSFDTIPQHGFNTASSDFGNCTYITPGISPLFNINAADMPHTPPFREAAGTDFAHREAVRVGKANDLVGFQCLVNHEFYADVRAEWEGSMKALGRLPAG